MISATIDSITNGTESGEQAVSFEITNDEPGKNGVSPGLLAQFNKNAGSSSGKKVKPETKNTISELIYKHSGANEKDFKVEDPESETGLEIEKGTTIRTID